MSDKDRSEMPHSAAEQDADAALSQSYAALVGGLTHTLDLSSGAAAALLPSSRDDLIEDLRKTLALKSGVETIAPSVPPPANEVRYYLASQLPYIETTGGFLDWLNAHPVKDRLDFRTHTDRPQHIAEDSRSPQRLECGCISTRHRVIRGSIRQVEIILSGVTTELEVENWEPGNEMVQAVESLAGILRVADLLEQPFEADLAVLRQRFSEIDYMLRELGAPTQLRDISSQLVDDFVLLDDVLNDYTDDDFSHIDLTEYRLEGIRWSRRTKWPQASYEQVKQRSVEVSPGIYVIQDPDSGGQADALPPPLS
jgi:hypothetical protein